MGTIDLDALRAAREEARREQETHFVTFGGHKFELPDEPPYSLLDALSKLSEEQIPDVDGVIRELLGDGYEQFREQGPSTLDGLELVKAASSIYNLGEWGEAPASSASSASISRRSRRTSRDSTGSTSESRSTGPRR